MTFNLRKQAAWCGTMLLLLQVFPFSFRQVHAVTEEHADEQLVQAFQSQKPDYLNLENPIMTSEASAEIVQSFSFVPKTFKTMVGQPVSLSFTSQLSADQVLVRVPQNGQISTSHLASGESVQHSHGEYWTFQTPKQQTFFTLPVVFESPGKYFLTIDHDADHFYLEVEEVSSGNPSRSKPVSEQVLTNETDELNGEVSLEKESSGQAEYSQGGHTLPDVLQPITAEEKNLIIPDELLKEEEKRILEETQVLGNRSASNVSNWSQFRSAWNSSSTTWINFNHSVDLATTGGLFTSLNSRSTSVTLTTTSSLSQSLDTRSETLKLSGSANITISNLTISSQTTINNYTIDHSGTGKVTFTNDSYDHTQRSSIQARNILIESGSRITGRVNLTNQGTLEIFSNGSNFQTGIVRTNRGASALTTTGTGHNIYIKGNDFLVRDENGSNARSWDTVDLHLSGIGASAINSAITSPDDFSSRYLGLSGSDKMIVLNGRTSTEWVNPPLPAHALMLKASPSEGGNPTADATTITQGSTTAIQANPNETFDFVRWDIVSGTGSSIANATNATTTFTMGTSDTTLQAVYQRKQGGDITVAYVDGSMNELAEPDIIRGLLDDEYKTQPKEIDGYSLNGMPENASGRFTEEAQTVTYTYSKDQLDPVSPLDPLAPDKEVDPENSPILPEDQGAFSIDFVSHFNFGRQVISTQDQTYYAQAQRLLKDDGTVDETEERPNYIQVSDRRPENQRDGWTLSVRQLENFQTKNNDHELIGASLRFLNQQVATAQDGTPPGVQETSDLTLIPGEKHILLQAKETEGAGTWIYRFGDAQSATQSVALDVPKTASPNAAQYQTTLSWELSAVPDN
ncbi:WxL domain-containing protein [Enterococcus casseliflavus]